MKREITFDEKENFQVASFNYVNKLDKKIKQLKKELEELFILEERLREEYRKQKIEYNETVLAQIGQGKYYNVYSEIFQIEHELGILEKATFNPFNGITNKENMKKYMLKKAPMEEDLENAKQRAKEFEKYTEQVKENYDNIKIEYEKCKNNIRLIKKSLKYHLKEKENILSQIRKVDSAFNKKRRINDKRLIFKRKVQQK